MIKLKDIVFGDVDFSVDDVEKEETKYEYDPNIGIIVVAMCCGGGRPVGTDPSPWRP